MKICLIGSTRFMDKFNEVNQKLTFGGHVVYSVAMAGVSPGEEEVKKGPIVSEGQKETLDLVHLLKIQNSDIVVLITDATGYIGTSTSREIKWCMLLGKEIMLPEQLRGLDDSFETVKDQIRKAVADVSVIDTHTKINGNRLKA